MDEKLTTPPQQEEKKETAKEPSTPLEWFHWIQDFTDKLTLKRIFTVLLAGLLITTLTLMYENRQQIFEGAVAYATNKKAEEAWVVTTETQASLNNLIKSTPIVKFAMITEVDLQKNKRVPLFWVLDDPNEAFIRAKANTLLPQAVFDYDAKNTQQMVAILNNEFVCAKFQDTVYQRFFPDLGKRMPIVCRLAIPPFYGRFVGILTIGLSAIPTKEENDSVRLEASRLAVEIYLRDVLRKPAPKQP